MKNSCTIHSGSSSTRDRTATGEKAKGKGGWLRVFEAGCKALLCRHFNWLKLKTSWDWVLMATSVSEEGGGEDAAAV